MPSVFRAGEAQLLALPEVQPHASELPRLASRPKVVVRGNLAFDVFSAFELSLGHRQPVS